MQYASSNVVFYLHNKRPQCVFLHLYHVKVILLKLFEITLVLILDLSCLLFNSLDTKLLTVFYMQKTVLYSKLWIVYLYL